MTQAIVGDTPLDTAISYAGKIYATSENFIIRFDGTTGTRELMSAVAAPMFGPMTLCQAGGKICVAAWNSPSESSVSADHVMPDIYIVNPATLATEGKLGIWGIVNPGFQNYGDGPVAIVALNNKCYYAFAFGFQSYSAYWINPLNVADRTPAFGEVLAQDTSWLMQMSTDGTNLYTVDSMLPGCVRYSADFVQDDSSDLNPLTDTWRLIGCEYCGSNGKVYAWGHENDLWRFDAFNNAQGDSAYINLSAFTPGGQSAYPIHVRYCAIDGKLYIPDQRLNGIIIYDPSGPSGTFQAGFDSPVDVVFSGAKKWAVQSGATALREIT